MSTLYTGTHNRKTYISGDTMDGFTVKVRDQDTQVPIVPTEVLAEIRDECDALVHTYTATIGIDGLVTLPSVVADWAKGNYRYDIQYTLSDGSKKLS